MLYPQTMSKPRPKVSGRVKIAAPFVEADLHAERGRDELRTSVQQVNKVSMRLRMSNVVGSLAAPDQWIEDYINARYIVLHGMVLFGAETEACIVALAGAARHLCARHNIKAAKLDYESFDSDFVNIVSRLRSFATESGITTDEDELWSNNARPDPAYQSPQSDLALVIGVLDQLRGDTHPIKFLAKRILSGRLFNHQVLLLTPLWIASNI